MSMKDPFAGGMIRSPNTKNVPQLETYDTFKSWISQQLKQFLKIEGTEEILEYILGLNDDNETKNYFHEILGHGNRVSKFLDTFFAKKHVAMPQRKTFIPDGVQVLKKNKDEDEDVVDSRKKKNKKKTSDVVQEEMINGIKVMKPKTKKKADDVPNERRYCECQATEHPLLRNCLVCGKIICAQEGEGPCIFCMLQQQKKSEMKVEEQKVVETTVDDQKLAESLEKAIQHKDKLLEFARTSAKRTMVYDDQADYYSVNQWIPSDEREKLLKQAEDEEKRKKEEKNKQRITFDFAGRKIILAEGHVNENISAKENQSSSNLNQNKTPTQEHTLIDPKISIPAPQFIDKNGKSAQKAKKKPADSSKKEEMKGKQRVQHDYYEDDL